MRTSGFDCDFKAVAGRHLINSFVGFGPDRLRVVSVGGVWTEENDGQTIYDVNGAAEDPLALQWEVQVVYCRRDPETL